MAAVGAGHGAQNPPPAAARREVDPESFKESYAASLNSPPAADRVMWPEKNLAGAGGFEPPYGGIKIRCLTTWLRPKTAANSAAARTEYGRKSALPRRAGP